MDVCSVIRLDKLRNKYIKGSFEITTVAEEMRGNRSRQVGPIEKNNNNTIKKIDEIRAVRNQGRSMPKKSEDMMECVWTNIWLRIERHEGEIYDQLA